MKINVVNAESQGEKSATVSLSVDRDGDLILKVNGQDVVLVFAEEGEVNDNVHSALQIAFEDHRCV